MFDLPEHHAIEVNAAGQGPAEAGTAVGVACWCGVDGCTQYAPALGGPWLATTCRRCNVTGICTPWSDYYVTEMYEAGKVCEPCLMALMRERGLTVERKESK